MRDIAPMMEKQVENEMENGFYEDGVYIGTVLLTSGYQRMAYDKESYLGTI